MIYWFRKYPLSQILQWFDFDEIQEPTIDTRWYHMPIKNNHFYLYQITQQREYIKSNFLPDLHQTWKWETIFSSGKNRLLILSFKIFCHVKGNWKNKFPFIAIKWGYCKPESSLVSHQLHFDNQFSLTSSKLRTTCYLFTHQISQKIFLVFIAIRLVNHSTNALLPLNRYFLCSYCDNMYVVQLL